MKKLVLGTIALAVVLAACSGTNSVVASVNGAEISRADVETMVRDAGDGFTNTDFATYLGVVIQWEATEQAAQDQLGLDVSEADIDARVDQLVTEFAPTATLDDYLEAVNASESGIRAFAKQLILQEAVQQQFLDAVDPIDDAAVEAELTTSKRDWTQVCASHILVATEDEAIAVKERLDAGEDFTALAAELSLDPGSASSGGDLGCSSPAGFVEPFAEATMTAPIGEVTDPVESEFGFHLIIVSDRVEATPDQVRQFLEQSQVADEVDAWFLDVITRADVEVDPEVGEWVTDPSPQVLAAN